MKRKLLCVLCVMFLCVAFRAEAAVSNKPIRIGVLRFESRTNEISSDQAAAVGDVFARMLTNSKTLTVIERQQLNTIANEHKLSTSGMLTDETALRVGKIAGCQYMLFGAVTNYGKHGSSVNLWMFGTQKYSAAATIDVRVVNVETTEVVLSLSETGSSSQTGTSFNFYGMTNDKVDLSGMEAGAITDAASRLSYRVRDALTGEHAQVLDVDGEELTIGIGSTGGAQLGGLYRVYVDGGEIRDIDGKILGHKMNDIAVVKIVDVQREFSIAHLAEKGAGNLKLIRRGDKIFPVNIDEMQSLIKRKAFMKSRPKERKNSDALNYILNSK